MDMNEFYITKVKRESATFDVSTRPDYNEGGKRIQVTIGGYIERLQGRQTLTVKLESSGPFDEAEIQRAMNEGKKVKIKIVE
jgi:hypothetical protein